MKAGTDGAVIEEVFNGKDVYKRQVHGEDGPAHSVGVGAEIAQQYGQQAAAHAEQGLSHRSDRCGGIVGGHEYRPQHQPAATQLGGHPGQRAPVAPGEKQGQQGDGPQICLLYTSLMYQVIAWM